LFFRMGRVITRWCFRCMAVRDASSTLDVPALFLTGLLG
jgi:hypothetical protein